MADNVSYEKGFETVDVYRINLKRNKRGELIGTYKGIFIGADLLCKLKLYPVILWRKTYGSDCRIAVNCYEEIPEIVR